MAPTAATGWLAVAGLAAALAAAPTRRVAAAAAVLALIPVAIMTATVYDSRYLTPFLPLWTLAAASGASALAGRLPSWARGPQAWLPALALLALPSVVPAVREAEREARVLERRLAFERASIAPLVTPPGAAAAHRALLFSDLPDFAAWTANRPVVWVTREEFGRLPAPGDSNPRGLPVRGDNVATWFHVAARDTTRAPR